MKTALSQRLVYLRKERGFTQKRAAESLGISQALLSHYEKGIRECGLGFLCSCADFYGVTTDYLLPLYVRARVYNDAPPLRIGQQRAGLFLPAGRLLPLLPRKRAAHRRDEGAKAPVRNRREAHGAGGRGRAAENRLYRPLRDVPPGIYGAFTGAPQR